MRLADTGGALRTIAARGQPLAPEGGDEERVTVPILYYMSERKNVAQIPAGLTPVPEPA